MLDNPDLNIQSVSDYFSGYMLNEISPSTTFTKALSDKVTKDWIPNWKDDKVNFKGKEKEGVTLESLQAMSLMANSGNSEGIKKSLSKIFKEASFSTPTQNENEIFFVTSKNTFDSEMLNPTELNYFVMTMAKSHFGTDLKSIGLN